MAHNYILRVTAGPDYDHKVQEIVPVNAPELLRISTNHMDIDLNIRIQNYRGLPRSSPSTSPYFSLPQHAKSGDQYSIAFRFTPKDAINGDDLVFGNDFDHPIRDRLPPGFGTAFKIVKWAIDPGLDGDVYADKPYLYGPLASSINTLRVGESGLRKESEIELGENGEGMVFEEGGEGDGEELRKERGVPDGEAARKKWFLTEANRKNWEFEAGREHYGDFFNPYLDFNDFALRLPGFTLPIMRYWDGQPLRYVLKNRKSNTVYLVVLFTLYLKEDINEDGSIKEGVAAGIPMEGRPKGVDDHEHDHDDGAIPYQDESEAEKHVNGMENGHVKAPVQETSPDDVD